MNELIFKPAADAVEPVTRAIGGTLAEFWQGVVGDRVTAWRIRNAVSIDKKLRDDLAASGTTLILDNLPEGAAFRWFQRATEADEPELQELFAKLLANAASGNEDALRKRNIELVSNLTPDDARLLAYIADRYAERNQNYFGHPHPLVMTYDHFFVHRYKEAGFNSELPIDALLSLGILRFDREFATNGHQIGQAISLATSEYARGSDIGLSRMFEQEKKLVLTEVGRSLLLALFPTKMAPPVER